jgi:benzoate membrane transport protein
VAERAHRLRDDVSAQAVATGVSAAALGYAGSVAVVVAGLSAVGADPEQVASALLALGVLMAVASTALSAGLRLPVAVVWSTPGAAVLIGVGGTGGGGLEGGFPAAVGALLVTAALIVLTGLVRPLGRLVARLPAALTAAVLAGVLLPFCLQSVTAIASAPVRCGAVAAVWLAAQRLAPAWSAPAALLALVGVAVATGDLPALGGGAPSLVAVTPLLTAEAVVRVALPLYLVTMAGQNLVGVAVLAAEGYRPPLAALLVGTGVASAAGAPFGAPTVNLAAITGALTAGPTAHPDPGRRWVAAAASGTSYLVLAALAPVAASLITGIDPRLVATAAGLALLGALAGSAAAAVREQPLRLPAVVTLVVTASGVPGAPAFGLGAGLLVLAVVRRARASTAGEGVGPADGARGAR